MLRVEPRPSQHQLYSSSCCFYSILMTTRNTSTYCMKRKYKAALDCPAARVASLSSRQPTGRTIRYKQKGNCVLSVQLALLPPLSARHPLYATLSLAQPCRRGMASSVRWSPSPHFVFPDLLVLVYRRNWRRNGILKPESKGNRDNELKIHAHSTCMHSSK